MNTIALFSDTAMLPGTHVTLASLLRAAKSPLRVVLFADGIDSKEKTLLHMTAGINNISGSLLEIRDFKPTAPREANALHGNTTVYGRLHLADLLPDTDFVLYLDCDLVVLHDDLDSLFSIRTDKLLIVDGMCPRRHTVDKALFEAANLDLDGTYFNSGVMGINLAKWRSIGASDACARVMGLHPGMFKAADQSVLNCAFHNDFLAIGDSINFPLYPTTRRVDAIPRKIIHFVGSPKPWDVGGRLHRNRHVWSQQVSGTALPSVLWRYCSPRRVILTLPALLRCWRANRRAD